MKFFKLSLIAATMAIVACSSINVDINSQVQIPAQFEQTNQATGKAEIARWWQNWNDPQLAHLIEKGLQQNFDVAIAKARLAEAMAGTDYANANKGINVAAQANIGGTRSNIENPITGNSNTSSRYTQFAAITASWEADFFGKKQADEDAAKATELAVQDQVYAAQMLVASQIAESYFNIFAIKQQSTVLKQSEKILSQLKNYVQGRFNAGQANANDVLEVESRITAIQAQQSTLTSQIATNERAIAVLTGQSPQGFHIQTSGYHPLNNLPATPAGVLPSKVLNQRPDLRTYANQVQAQAAKLASAKADLYPRFDIQFLGGTGRIDLNTDIAELKGWGGLLSAGLSVPIFTNGRIQANIDAADARLKAALLQYDKGILQALADVDNSYQAQYALNRQTQLIQTASKQAQKHANQAEKLFKYGEKNLDNVLTAQLTALDTQRQIVDAQLKQAKNLVGLYKALGGGWQK